MRTTFRRSAIAALALSAAGFVAPQAAQAGNRDFTLVNNMPFTTAAVLIRPTGTETWSPDILGSMVLEPGQRATLRVGQGPQCVFDVRVVGVRPGQIGLYNFNAINLCRLDVMTTSFDGTPRAVLRNVN